MEYEPISEGRIKTYNIDGSVFNAAYRQSVEKNRITEGMGYFILKLANNIVAKYNGKYRFEIVEEMHQRIVIDITERLLTMTILGDPFATISVAMRNRCTNYIRDIGRGNVDIYGTRIGDRTTKTKFISLTDYENYK